MEGLSQLLNADVIAVLIPIVGIVAVFGFLGVKAYFRHLERMEKIRNGMDPDVK